MGTEYEDQMLGQKETCDSYKHDLRVKKVLTLFEDACATDARGKVLSMRDVKLFYNNEYKTFSINHELNVVSIDLVELIIKELYYKDVE